MSRVLLSDLLNSENQAKFRLVKATLDAAFFYFIGTCMERAPPVFFFPTFTQFHSEIGRLEVKGSPGTGRAVLERMQFRRTTVTRAAFVSSRKDELEKIQEKLPA